MKTIRYIVLVVMLAWYPSKSSQAQSESFKFCETFTQEEVFSKLKPEDRFFKLVQRDQSNPESSILGRCTESDLESLWEYVQSDQFKEKVQADLQLAAGTESKENLIPIYALRISSSSSGFPLAQNLEEVRITSSDSEKNHALLITFSDSGAEKWASITRLNKGRDIAMLSKGKVISAPRVMEEIKDGKCMISGNFAESDLMKIKAILEN